MSPTLYHSRRFVRSGRHARLGRSDSFGRFGIGTNIFDLGDFGNKIQLGD